MESNIIILKKREEKETVSGIRTELKNRLHYAADIMLYYLYDEKKFIGFMRMRWEAKKKVHQLSFLAEKFKFEILYII